MFAAYRLIRVMMKLRTASYLLLILPAMLALSACRLPSAGAPSATSLPPTETLASVPPLETLAPSATPEPSATHTPSATPTSSGPCEITTASGVNVYTRPSTAADLFYTTEAEEQFPPALARTADGWIGFDPGVAQAANTGPFRLRWLQENEAVLEGDCASLPVVQGPAPGVCFDMISAPTDVHSAPDSSTSVLLTLNYGDYAEVLGVTPDEGWVKISLLRGSPSQDLQGWVDIASINVNGPCLPFPTVAP